MAYKKEDTASWDTRKAREGAEKASAGKGRGEAVPKRRRKHRSGMNPMLYVILVLVISGLLACVGWLLMDDLCSLNKPYVEVQLEVTADDDISSVTDKLHDAGLVNFPWFFRLFTTVIGADVGEGEDIGYGTFALNSNMDFFSLVDGMYVRSSKPVDKLETVVVTISEGHTVRETIAILAEKGVNTEEKLLEAAQTAEFDYDFIDNDSEDISRLEGYLFPDTYEFYVGHDPKGALSKLLSNFNKKMTAERKGQAAELGYTPEEIVIIASLIEKETDGTDRNKIASVIYNRLKDTNGRHGTYGVLGIDAALLYVLPDNNGVIHASDLEMESPYNLRKYAGLPPTAIANPGLKSIDAALNPADTDYYYYALGKDGVHHYNKTAQAHQNFVNSDEFAG